ncbi:MFS transporter [Streptomyces sp. NBC_01481]|uniref:MFS transporter n=1 Tax=Streptomyces sp. NBC_01481 TaxID=2975869 RepID=UPI002256D7E4|nr:MFS transporter [Streptomyces sp. NBC_01481]MCX4586331.1 MFS transporter [Streptomyces sp. NBC_01481]
MTSPASGAGSASDPPDYAPTTRSERSESGRAASPSAPAGGRDHRLGLALLVIATAQLMVVLDATIVNVALPDIQQALGFSGSGLEWVVNAYAVTFGGLLLLGGRAGDILGRRRMFVFGLLLFSAASLLGGFATSQSWLLTARAVQGVGGAVIAPTALALITTNFPEGGARNRAFGVYAAMAGAGSAVGLLLGGILTTYASWRWVMFVNVPIGILVAAAAPRMLTESPRRPGRIDVAGAITGTGGVALLVYGLSKAATGPDGVSHWGDAQVVASLAASVVLLVSFVLVERRSSHPLLPMRVLADRNRSGAYLIMLCVSTGLFGLFFFLTLFIQNVLGYSAIRTGIAYLAFAIGVVIASALASQLVPRFGSRPLIVAGTAAVAGGMFWFSMLTEHAGYAGQLLGPMLVSSFGLGLVFVPLALVALHDVAEQDSGVASSLLNAAQQVGGAIGLALLGTVAWTTTADSVRTQVAQAGRPLPKPGTPPPASIYDHALTVGFSRAFLVAAGIGLLGLLIAITTIRVPRQELSGAVPARPETAPQPAVSQPMAQQPVTVQQQEDRAALAAAARPCRLC